MIDGPLQFGGVNFDLKALVVGYCLSESSWANYNLEEQEIGLCATQRQWFLALFFRVYVFEKLE